MKKLTKTELATLEKNWNSAAKEFKADAELFIKNVNKHIGDLENMNNNWAINHLNDFFKGHKEYNHSDSVTQRASALQDIVLHKFFKYSDCGLVADDCDDKGLLNDERSKLENDTKNLLDEAIRKLKLLTKTEATTLIKSWNEAAKEFNENTEIFIKNIIKQIDDNKELDNAWAIKLLNKLLEGNKEYNYTNSVGQGERKLQKVVLFNFFETSDRYVAAYDCENDGLLNYERGELEAETKNLVNEAIKKLEQ